MTGDIVVQSDEVWRTPSAPGPCRCELPTCYECLQRMERTTPPAWYGAAGSEQALAGGLRTSLTDLARDLGAEFAKASEVQPAAVGQTAAATAAATAQRSSSIGTRRVWHNRIVEKLKDGTWHVVGHVAGLEDPNKVKQFEPHQLTPEALADLIRKLLHDMYSRGEHRQSKTGGEGQPNKPAAAAAPKAGVRPVGEQVMKSAIETLMDRNLTAELRKSFPDFAKEKGKDEDEKDEKAAKFKKADLEDEEKKEIFEKSVRAVFSTATKEQIAALRKSLDSALESEGMPSGMPTGPSEGSLEPSDFEPAASLMTLDVGGLRVTGFQVLPAVDPEAPGNAPSAGEFSGATVTINDDGTI